MVEDKGKFNKTTLFFLFLNFLVISIMLFNYYAFAHIKLNGDNLVVLNYMEEYKEKGFSATRFNTDINHLVVVGGKVNSKKLGSYEISYEVPGLFGKRVVRTVRVEDKESPVIKLLDDKDIYLCPNHKYEKEKVNAVDNYDGDLSEKVAINVYDDKVIYMVEDTSGNKTKITRNIIYEDKEKPVLNVNGSKYVYAFLNEEYVDDGGVASDNCDGDISNSIVVENKVDITKVGTYEVVYSVTDTNGNTSSDNRNVVVSERNKPGSIYLTFDDGPQWGTTDKILDILKEEGVEATFFITNKGPDELIKRMYDEGHTVALHTATHDYASVYASVDSYFNDLHIVNDRVKRITGSYSYIIRFPGGSSNTISRRYSSGIMSRLVQEVINRGFRYYDWNISSGDAAGGNITADQIKSNVINNLNKSRDNVVLMHDIKTYTRDALRDIILYGKDNGYTFEKITMNTTMVRQRVNN